MVESQPRRQKIGGSKDKKRITRNEYQRLVNKFEMEGCMAQKGLWNLAREKGPEGQRRVAKGRR